jgi:hypothetical protein
LINLAHLLVSYRDLLPEYNEDHIPILVRTDNIGAITLATKPEFRKKTWHINMHYHYARAAVENGEITIRHVSTNDMVADIFTKALPKPAHSRFASMMGLRSETGDTA